MKRSTIIASCLVNSNMIARVEDAETAVQSYFREDFPDCSFSRWNQEVDDKAAQHIINSVGRAMTINVVSFIRDLGNPCG